MARSKTIWLYTPENLSVIDPTPLRSRLAPLKYDGECGIIKSERDDVLKETRFDYLYTKRRAISYQDYDGEFVERELSYEKVYPLQLRFNAELDLLIVECRSSKVVGEVVPKIEAALGCTLHRQSFDTLAMRKLEEMADDVRRVKLHGIEDPFLRQLYIKGEELASSREFKTFRSKGRIQEMMAKVTLPSGAAHTVALQSKGKMRVSRRGADLDSQDLFYLIRALAD